MTDPTSIVDLATLQRTALYQQIVGEIVTLFHLCLLGGLGLLFMRWKERRANKQLEKILSTPPSGEGSQIVVCKNCGIRLVCARCAHSHAEQLLQKTNGD